jgi:hypothetical protein
MNTQSKVQELITLGKTKEAIVLLREKSEDKRYKNTLIVLESRISKLKEEEHNNVQKNEDIKIEENKIKIAVLEISDDIVEVVSVQKAKKKLGLWFMISIPILFVTSLVLLDFYFKKSLIAIGGGTVYAYLLSNIPEMFEGFQLTEPKVVPLETPTLTGIEAFIYTYQHGEPEDNDFKHLPPVVGMASMELSDTLFSKVRDIAKNNKIYAIQIGLDSLFISVGNGTDEHNAIFKEEKFGLFDQSGRKMKLNIPLEKVSVILSDPRIKKFVNVPNSGSFNTWNSSFINAGLPPIDTNSVSYANRNNNQSLDIIRHSTLPWVLLDSKKYNITSHLKSELHSIEVLKDSNPLTRPLFIYGRADVKTVFSKIGKEKEKEVYPINDNVVCKFWSRLINKLNKNNLMDSTYVKTLNEDFLVKTPDRKDCNCGIVVQGTNLKNGIVETDRLIIKKYK